MIKVKKKTALDLLATQQDRGLTQFEIMLGTGLRQQLMPDVLKTLERHNLADKVPNDENGWCYRITPAGVRHVEEVRTQKRISSFRPKCISYPPVAA